MFDDDLPKKPRLHEVGMILDAMSVDELTDRIALLRGEIARLEQAIAVRQQTKAAAASLFKF